MILETTNSKRGDWTYMRWITKFADEQGGSIDGESYA